MRLITPEYGAPEQRHDGPITTATDVYALGVVLYELLTGLRPRELGTPGRRTRRRESSAVTAPSEAVRRLASAQKTSRASARSARCGGRAHTPTIARSSFRRIRGDLDRIVLTALREEPERRYASAGQLGEEIERFLGGHAVLAQPDTLRYRARKFVGRNRLAVTAAAVLVSASPPLGSWRGCRRERWPSRVASRGSSATRRNRSWGFSSTLFETTNPAVRPDGDRMSIREFLAGAEGRALSQLSGAPLVRAKLKQVFGLIHHERGEYTPARQALEEALAEQRRLVGPDHPDALESLHALGKVLYEAADESRAGSLLQESLARHRRVYGDEHEKTARALFALAPLAASKDLEAAEALLTQALDIRRRVLAENDPELAINLGALAEHYNTRATWNNRESCIGRRLQSFVTRASGIIPGPSS